MGNLRSVEKALERAGAKVTRTSDHHDARAAAGVVLPGVGAFPRAMERVRELALDQLVAERAAAGTPVLGICLGLQLLFDSSTEQGGGDGLGLLPGPVGELRTAGLKLPHIGWSPVSWRKRSPLSKGLAEGEPFYFVHSFGPRPARGDDVLGTAEHGEPFVCAVERENVAGVQFHPEKSGAAGLRLLRNFVELCAAASPNRSGSASEESRLRDGGPRLRPSGSASE